jgi:hypothetical protein
MQGQWPWTESCRGKGGESGSEVVVEKRKERKKERKERRGLSGSDNGLIRMTSVEVSVLNNELKYV